MTMFICEEGSEEELGKLTQLGNFFREDLSQSEKWVSEFITLGNAFPELMSNSLVIIPKGGLRTIAAAGVRIKVDEGTDVFLVGRRESLKYDECIQLKARFQLDRSLKDYANVSFILFSPVSLQGGLV